MEYDRPNEKKNLIQTSRVVPTSEYSKTQLFEYRDAHMDVFNVYMCMIPRGIGKSRQTQSLVLSARLDPLFARK